MMQQTPCSYLSRVLFSALLGVAFLVNAVQEAEASPKQVKQLTRLEQRIARMQARLERKFYRVSLSDRAQVVAARSGRSDDSDFDGVPDNLEKVQSTCNSDSDDDGLDDGDEYSSGKDPEDEDSDDDGYSDSDEIERNGPIQAISSSSVTVKNTEFLLTKNTRYGRFNQSVTLVDFEVGDCVEVEGHLESGNILVADHMKFDSCDDDSDDDDDSSDD